jgi:formyltetrahydrofolate-dependent phosphoribosylglycinamide formyltransferase
MHTNEHELMHFIREDSCAFVAQTIMNDTPIKLAVLISGSGTTLQNLIDQIAAKKLNASIELVIASRPDIKGIERARSAGLECVVIDRREYHSVNHFSKRVFTEINRNDIDLICLAGWLCLLNIPMRYDHKLMNIHPALLPSFGGKGMYGHHVHQAVLDYGAKVSGCTVHFVDNEYDQGPIILQRAAPVLEDDTAEVLATRVFEEEKIAYPEAIRLYQQKRLVLEDRRVRIKNV